MKEIRLDLKSQVHMNRLLQGDVGSGKTVVGLMSMLMALDNGYQACMLAPTEILAKQHLISISETVEGLGIEVAFLILSFFTLEKYQLAVLEEAYP